MILKMRILIKYFGPREMRREIREGSTMKNFIFIVKIVRVIKSRRLSSSQPVARMEEGMNGF